MAVMAGRRVALCPTPTGAGMIYRVCLDKECFCSVSELCLNGLIIKGALENI